MTALGVNDVHVFFGTIILDAFYTVCTIWTNDDATDIGIGNFTYSFPIYGIYIVYLYRKPKQNLLTLQIEFDIILLLKRLRSIREQNNIGYFEYNHKSWEIHFSLLFHIMIKVLVVKII